MNRRAGIYCILNTANGKRNPRVTLVIQRPTAANSLSSKWLIFGPQKEFGKSAGTIVNVIHRVGCYR